MTAAATSPPQRQPSRRCAASHEALTASPPNGSKPVTRIVPKPDPLGEERAHVGEPAHLQVGVAVSRVDHRQALEQMADLVFHRHPDAAMDLYRLLADESGGAA